MTSSPSPSLLLPVEERTRGETVGAETLEAIPSTNATTTSKTSSTTTYLTKQSHHQAAAAGKSAVDLLAQFQETYGRAQCSKSNLPSNEPSKETGRCLLPASRSSSTSSSSSSSSTGTHSDLLREEDEEEDEHDFKEEDFVNLSEDTTTMMMMTMIRFWHIFLSVLSCCCLPLSLLGEGDTRFWWQIY